MPSITEEMLRDMASVIARQVSPEAIIRFGSRATDKADAGSDIDLIVVASRPYGPGNDRRQKATLLGEPSRSTLYPRISWSTAKMRRNVGAIPATT